MDPGLTPTDGEYARGPVGLGHSTVVRVASRERAMTIDLRVSPDCDRAMRYGARHIPAIREGDSGLRGAYPAESQPFFTS